MRTEWVWNNGNYNQSPTGSKSDTCKWHRKTIQHGRKKWVEAGFKLVRKKFCEGNFLSEFNLFFYDTIETYKQIKHMRPVLTKWATSRQGTKGDMAYWTFQKSVENKGNSQGNNRFWTPNKAATITCNISF